MVVKRVCFAACLIDASGGEWRLLSSSRKVPQNSFLELRLPWEAGLLLSFQEEYLPQEETDDHYLVLNRLFHSFHTPEH